MHIKYSVEVEASPDQSTLDIFWSSGRTCRDPGHFFGGVSKTSTCECCRHGVLPKSKHLRAGSFYRHRIYGVRAARASSRTCPQLRRPGRTPCLENLNILETPPHNDANERATIWKRIVDSTSSPNVSSSRGSQIIPGFQKINHQSSHGAPVHERRFLHSLRSRLVGTHGA